jgi:hypothetical protein
MRNDPQNGRLYPRVFSTQRWTFDLDQSADKCKAKKQQQRSALKERSNITIATPIQWFAFHVWFLDTFSKPRKVESRFRHSESYGISSSIQT